MVKPMGMDGMEVGQVRQRRLSDDIVAQLETMILEGTLRAGERLPAERALAEQFGNLDDLMNASAERIEETPDVGPVVSAEVAKFFADPQARLLVVCRADTRRLQ